MKIDATSGRKGQVRRAIGRRPRLSQYAPPSTREPRLKEYLGLAYAIVVLLIRSPRWLFKA